MNLKNRLADTTSPYLLQHADNPVHWQPWDEQALAAARQINRPILLSVGYSACHWCHVMAHECFEDPEVAEIMNAEFINIKVDREERPDIDQIYMAALAATGEQGGWPLTMFLTPDAKPFWGGTYFPKHPRYDRPGFMQILANIAEAWKEKGREVENGATALHNHVKKHLAADDGAELAPDPEPMLQMAQRIQKLMDPKFGGMSGAPKFPNFPYMQCLWLAALETGDANYAESVTDSLEKMLQGGIYDHIGGGLCRYSTDEQWLVPHFEKMLYDNAQLIRLLVQAHAATGKKQFRDRIEDVVGWFRREMLLPNGGLASSYDADSEGSEGKYYLWQKSQIEQVLDERTERFFEYFRLQSPPQWEGDPILTRKPDSDGAGDFISGCLKDLRIKREKRVRPERDDKLLVDWNGMAIRAIADAARHFDQPAWGKLAEDIFDAVEGLADPTGRLPHSANSNKARFPALASDYASMINAAGSLFELTGEKAILNTALRWAEILDEEHGDQNGSHFLTARSAQDVPMRIRGDTDEAIPSATAQIIEALSRLSAALTDPDLQERAYRCAAQGLARAVKQGHGQAGIFTSAYLASKHGKLITVDSSDDRFARVARQYFDPRRLDIAVRTGDANEALLPGGSQTLDTSRPSAWLCNDQTCLPPIYDPHKLELELQKKLVFYKPMKKTG